MAKGGGCKAWAPGMFDALLLDISMPVMDGQEALAQICNQASSRSIHILIQSLSQRMP